jgi:ABC-2 type transport system permease protein
MIKQGFLDRSIVQRSASLRTFITAAWLGWQIESNWADPFLFAVYSIVRPLASVSILVVMYSVITDGALDDPLFAYIYLGNALYILVGQVITGVSWVIIDDREHYRVAKQLYTMPISPFFYLMGRGVARLMIGMVSLLITVGVGIIAFDLPITLTDVNIPLLIVSMVVGIVSLACIGLILGAVTLSMARHFWSVGEAVAGALYLFTGAIFPIEVLPSVLQPFSYALPMTYWLEVTRRALLGSDMATFPTFAEWSDGQLLGVLSLMTLFVIGFSWWFFQAALTRAKNRGMLDMESSY